MVKINTGTRPDENERLVNAKYLGWRWGEHSKVAYKKALDRGASPIRFNARNIKFRLSDIIKIEEEATVL